MLLSINELLELSRQQARLDNYIEARLTDHPSQDRLFDQRLVAFMVELGEYANEERSFKYWSHKPPSPIGMQLEEYIDGLHFLLGLGNMIHYDFTTFNGRKTPKTKDHVDMMLFVMKQFFAFQSSPTVGNYTKLLDSYIQLGVIHGYNHDDVIQVYRQKNAVNYHRQNENY